MSLWKKTDWTKESSSKWTRKDGCVVEEMSIFCWIATSKDGEKLCTKSARIKEFDSAEKAMKAADKHFENTGFREENTVPYRKGSLIQKGDVFQGPDYRIIVRMRTSVVTSFRLPGGAIDSIPNDRVEKYLRDYERVIDTDT